MKELKSDLADEHVTAKRGETDAASNSEFVARASVRGPLLSPADLASYLAVPLATVYGWRSRREGPRGIRVGRHVRYRVEDVERWLDEQREQRP